MKKFLFFIICMLAMGFAYSQSAKPEVVATAGDYFKNANYSLSWTLGECVTETYSSGTNTLTQGFQQSTYTITAINDIAAFNGISVKAFPNPVTDFITVQVVTANDSPKGYSFELYNVQGKLLTSEALDENSKQVNMLGYAKGIYFLNVSEKGKNMLRNFKIIKN